MSLRRSARSNPPAPVPTLQSQPPRKRGHDSQAPSGSSDGETNKRSKRQDNDHEKLAEDAEDDDGNEEKEEEVQQERLPSAVPLETMTSKVFEYSFIVQLMMEYLLDNDVLINLILTSHSVNRSIVSYPVKKPIGSKTEFAEIKRTDLTTALPNIASFISPSHKRLYFTSASYTIRKDRSWLPSSVTTLTEKHCNPIDLPFPSHITDLSLTGSCKQPIDLSASANRLPERLKSLQTNFELFPGCIPAGVETLVLNEPRAWRPDYVIQAGLIPDAVKDLTITGYYMHPHVLTSESKLFPENLVKLKIQGNLLVRTPLVRGLFQSSIKDLTLDQCHHEGLDPGCLPSALVRLKIEFSGPDFPLSSSNNQDSNQLLKRRIIPDTVSELVYHKQKLPNNKVELQVSDLPPSLRVLDLGGYTHRLCLGVLPSTLRELTIRGNNGGDPLEAGVIPDGVTHLKLLAHVKVTTGFKPIAPGVIPSSVLYLEWEYDAKSKPPIVGAIPSSVKTLVFGPHFTRALPIGFIPSSVRSLTFGTRFKNGGKPLEIGVIPFGVKYLRFGAHFDNGAKPLSVGAIPPAVTHLYFPRDSVFRNRSQSLFAAIPASVVVLELPPTVKLD